jgi:hypothetical protein
VLIGIVAPKGAGSSPVGHPPMFRIGKPNRRKTKESRYKHRGCDSQAHLAVVHSREALIRSRTQMINPGYAER